MQKSNRQDWTMKRSLLHLVLLVTSGIHTASAKEEPLRLTQIIPLAGVEGRIDHFAFDGGHQRLFLCALGQNAVEVINLATGERVHAITGLKAPQGIAYVPELDRIFVANDEGGICNIFDAKSFQPMGKLDFKDDADNVRYDEATKKIYIGFGSGGLAVVNATDGKQLGSIKLAAHPEAFVLEKGGPRIFVNVPNSHHVAVVDRNKGEVIATWGTNLAFGNFPIALDEANNRLFVGCRVPSKLVVFDTNSGRAVTSITIPGDADDIFYDAKRHRIYAICGAGKIEIIEQANANAYKISATIETASGTRTGLFVPERDMLFVAVPHRDSQQAEVRAYQVE
jgi:DNA-binding beta-propeller fold protein YncE